VIKTNADFPKLLQAFFTDRLIRQRDASQNTIASYRDAFRLFLGFAQQRLKKAPSEIEIEDLDTPFIGVFLDHLEKDRGNSARSRNVRLAAIHSFFQYVALHEPSHGALAQRILAIPSKKYKQRQIEFLTRSEVEALLEAPDQNTWARGGANRYPGIGIDQFILQRHCFGKWSASPLHWKGSQRTMCPIAQGSASCVKSLVA